MKAHVLLGALALAFPISTFAQTAPTSDQLTQFKNVRVSMQRMLKSTDGRYFVDVYAGVWNPRAQLTDTKLNKTIDLKGLQKGSQLNLRSFAENGKGIASTEYALDGTLNIISSQFDAKLTAQGNTQNIHFEPAFKATDKPALNFKFYGVENAKQPYGKSIQRIDVVNKADGKVLQTLNGFSVFGNTIGYLDVNFDGYYDVVLSNTDGYKVEDKRFIYWMYNPKTRQFQRAPQLEKIVGFPKLDAQKQQIHYSEKVVYQVKAGLLNLL